MKTSIKKFFDHLEWKGIHEFSMTFQRMKCMECPDHLYLQEGILRGYEIERTLLYYTEINKNWFRNPGDSPGRGSMEKEGWGRGYWWAEFQEGDGFGFGRGWTKDSSKNPIYPEIWDIVKYSFSNPR